MKLLTRILALLLAIMTLACLAVACADPQTPSEDVTTTTPQDSAASTTPVADTTTDQYSIESNLPNSIDFGGKEVRILSRDYNGVRDELTVSDLSGETVNDAIYNRNLAVEYRIGVTIQNTQLTGDSYVVTSKIRNLVKAQTDEFDVMANSCYSTIMYTSEGLMQDLSDVEYLDLSQIYWSQGFNEVASFGNRQYLCAGSYGLSLYRYMFVTMFNKDLMAEHGVTNLYEVVNNGQWTLDYQASIASQMYYDVNGDGIANPDDRYGFLSGPVAYVDPYWSSCKLPILTKNADNQYQNALDIDRISTAMDKVLHLYYDCGGSYIYPSVSDTADQDNIANHFADGRAGMCTLRLLAVETQTLRDMSQEYGIIPIPMLDEAQNGYQTYVHDQFTAFGIPATVPEDRLDRVGAFLECAAFESYREVIPAYFEVALKNKYVSDPESGKMLDMIYENVYIDGGVLYTKSLNSVHQQLRTIVKSKNNMTASIFRSLNRTLPTLLDKLNNGIESLG